MYLLTQNGHTLLTGACVWHGMVRYDLQIHTSANRDLDALPHAARARLPATLADVAECRKVPDHASVRMLEGQDGLYRVRTGDLRAVLQLDKPHLNVVACGRRASVYDDIDEVADRRVTA